LPQHIDEMRVAGMSSTLLALGQRAAVELERGHVEQVLIRGEAGYVVLINAAHGTSLLTMATHDAKLGLVFLDMTRAAKEIARIL
jgi:predicted regulator of Ras-like GTPase activity (Roadblock/LC7/MglB family)